MLVYYFNLNDVKHEWSEHAGETAVDRRRLVTCTTTTRRGHRTIVSYILMFYKTRDNKFRDNENPNRGSLLNLCVKKKKQKILNFNVLTFLTRI